MSRTQNVLLVLATGCGAMLISYVAIALIFVTTVNRFGTKPIYAAMSPHNAYVLWRARRDIMWHGIRIRVGPDYVLEPESDRVQVHHVDSMSIIVLDPGMMFYAADTNRTQSFRQDETRCDIKAEQPCTILRATLPSGVLTCHQHLGRRSRPTFGTFELWVCEDANGLRAVFFETPAECVARKEIAVRAFATAPASATRTDRAR